MWLEAATVAERMTVREARITDGARLWRLVRDMGGLELNSAYFYLLYCRDHARTSLVAETDGRLAGFVSCLLTATPGEVKLDKLYVDPQRQRLGLGRRLVDHVVARALAAGCETLILAVNKHNTDAIAAYRKQGFAVRESVCVDIGGGFVMDDFIMARSLPSPVAGS